MTYTWPLMGESITRQDIICLTEFLAQPEIPRLTNGEQVVAFEQEFAAWLGVKHAVMVSSGASANLITMQALKILHGVKRVLVPCITWVSDIAAVLHAVMEPLFVDVDSDTLGMSIDGVARIVRNNNALFPTHCLGFDSGIRAFTSGHIIEDCCESLGASRDGKMLGTFGLMSNFSFYYAHHITTIEGGMVCTDDIKCYQLLRQLRAHGLVREMSCVESQLSIAAAHPLLDPQFIFSHPAYNCRPTELNAVLGRSQLKRLDANVAARTANLLTFLEALDGERYRVNYRTSGSSNYALPLILVEKDDELFAKVLWLLRQDGIEYRKGTAGGGNQLRQPYAKERWGDDFHRDFPEAEHISDFGLYFGNYPGLDAGRITALCERLNRL